MSFFTTIRKSFYDTAWLKEQKNKPGAAWGYFFKLATLLFIIIFIPQAFLLIRNARGLSEALSVRVPNFEASLNNGVLVVDKLSQPYILRDYAARVVLVIDTTATSSPSFRRFLDSPEQSGLLITKEGMELYDANSLKTRTQAWRGLPNFTINQAQVISLAQKYTGFPYILLFVGGLAILFYLVLLLSKLMALLVVATIVLFVNKVFKRGWKWGELFTVGLYALTVPSFLVILFGLASIEINYLHFLALLAFMLAIVLTKDAVEVTPSVGKDVPKPTGEK